MTQFEWLKDELSTKKTILDQVTNQTQNAIKELHQLIGVQNAKIEVFETKKANATETEALI